MSRRAAATPGRAHRVRRPRWTLGLLALAATAALGAGGAGPLPDEAIADAAATAPDAAPGPALPVAPVTGASSPVTGGDAPPAPETAEGATDPGIGSAPVAESGDAAVTGGGSGAAVRPVLVVASGGASAGSGRPLRYTVEVEPATGLDPDAVAAEVDAALGDPRSWARDRLLERVADVAAADARVVVATPATVDALCAAAGLDTAGIFSCWTGRIAALNAWRWETGASGFPDVGTYRTYLVNHEVGHALGYGHRRCPGPGAVAPVMMQQSKGLDGCIPNGWPHP